ncbi:MAG: hypothetical protein NVS2B15_11360 [Pseudarthrobacter sp.]
MSAERMFEFIPCDDPDPDPWVEAAAATAEVRQFARESLRWQAQEIIDEVLGGTDPGEELARARLRRCVAQNPGRPERALLQQLMVNRDHYGGSTL